MSFAAIIEELYMVWSFSEKSKVAFVYFGKRSTDRKEGEKLSSLEPKVSLFYLHCHIRSYPTWHAYLFRLSNFWPSLHLVFHSIKCLAVAMGKYYRSNKEAYWSTADCKYKRRFGMLILSYFCINTFFHQFCLFFLPSLICLFLHSFIASIVH